MPNPPPTVAGWVLLPTGAAEGAAVGPNTQLGCPALSTSSAITGRTRTSRFTTIRRWSRGHSCTCSRSRFNATMSGVRAPGILANETSFASTPASAAPTI